MPYGSHSPITLRLTELFRSPSSLPLDYLLKKDEKLVDRAAYRFIVRNDFEKDHLGKWPANQQELVRAVLIQSIREGRPIVFDWEEAKTTSTTVMDFGDTLAVTFRSPAGKYPPYDV